jgi:hypothetical protein
LVDAGVEVGDEEDEALFVVEDVLVLGAWRSTADEEWDAVREAEEDVEGEAEEVPHPPSPSSAPLKMVLQPGNLARAPLTTSELKPVTVLGLT